MGTISKHKFRGPLLRNSSQLRFALAYILITAAALLFLNFYASASMQDMVFRSQEKSQADKAQLLTAALLQLDTLSVERTAQAVESLEELLTTRTIVTDASGRAVYDSLRTGSAVGRLVLFPELADALAGNDVFYGRYDSGAFECRTAAPLVRGGEVLGAVYLMEYDSVQGALIFSLQRNILTISVILELAVVLISLIFSSTFSRKLRKIVYSVRQMLSGDYSSRIELRGHSEVDQLSREFNHLADRLNESEQRRRQFVSDASHELKTPLASIKLLSDSILQNEMDTATEHEFIADIGREADRLGRLSQKLLTLTRLDSGVVDERSILDAAPTVCKVVRMLRPQAALRSVRLSVQADPGCLILMMEDDLSQIVFNLAENAIKYNREGGEARVRLSRLNKDVELSVEDNGPGIPAEAREHIFERFYRVDKARSRAAGGAGLGLSIVYDMVRRNDGTIAVDDAPQGGTVFTVRFPLFDPQEVEQ